jgi:rhamnopyranosyl-N-acetylglucosaminyl-diphospho-decaprenol beta-1,3/1,4-galactofuranosyltransferase
MTLAGVSSEMAEASKRETARPRSQPSVGAVVVTFNRKDLLAECLEALLGQIRPVDRIFIVDQASTDGTGEMLRDRGYLQKSSIFYSRSEKNTGGAGGFQRGVELAYAAGFDWIWLMDDDAIAKPDALDKMLPYLNDQSVCAVANAKLRLNGTLDDGHMVLERNGPSAGEPAYLTFSSFVGLMVSNRAVESIGFPKAEFFLQGDDTEYCIRLCKVGRIVFARDSALVHKEISRPPELVHRFGRDFTIYPKDRFCFQYFLWRNRVWIELYGRGFRPDRICWVASKVLRVLIRTCLIDRSDLSFRLFILLRAVADGMRGRFDNEFPFRMRDRLMEKANKRSSLEGLSGSR